MMPGKMTVRPVLQRAAFASTLGAVGFFLNLYPIPLFANLQLILGNMVILLCASRLGLPWVLWTAALAVTGLHLTWDVSIAYLIFGLEAVCLALLRKRGWYLLYADIVYWIFFGMPITAIAIFQWVDLPQEYGWFTIWKQGFNGVLYSAFASLLLMGIPKGWLKRIRQQPVLVRTFRQKQVHAMVALLSVTLMVMLLAHNRQLMATQKVMHYAQLSAVGKGAARQLEDYLERHKGALMLAGRWFSHSGEDAQADLAALHRSYPGFASLFITDSEGQVLGASPPRRLAAYRSINVSAWPDFKAVMATSKPYLSDVIRDRVFGRAPIVTVSAPRFSEAGEVVGTVEGALDLSALNQQLAQQLPFEWVLQDKTGRIVVASASLGLAPLSRPGWSTLRPVELGDPSLIRLESAFGTFTDYLRHQRELESGWTLNLVVPYLPLVKQAESQFGVGTAVMVVALLLAVALAAHQSRYLTLPLEVLAKDVEQPEAERRPLRRLPQGSAREILQLQKQMAIHRSALWAHQDELEAQVMARTEELAEANRKLAILASRDGLTGAYNRRYFVENFESIRQWCIRGDHALLMVMLDIDHFKQVNDTYGHLVGDECLQRLVALMQAQFGRHNDLLSRFGGEEFVLLLPGLGERDARNLLATLVSTVAEQPMATTSTGQPLTITVSLGAVLAPASFSPTLADWLSEADRCLYRAKQEGRNRMIFKSLTPSLTRS
ncbi:diguanylate cyclase [Ferrimonas gelatinilytica]|uniref:diguanylate cyclase n=1 Tax=Ferrimonas gelatinilytica TaxID=1255257 RepID=A0ABP9RW40_9GAMM